MRQLLRLAAGITLLIFSTLTAQAQNRGRKPAPEPQKRIAMIEAKAVKIQSSNEIVVRTFDAGNQAAKAGNYDAAIAAYDEGLDARPDESGLLINKSIALTNRGVARYNNFITNKDRSSRDAAHKDWRHATDTARKALESIKSTPASPANQAAHDLNRLAALGTRAEAMRFVASKVDRSQADAASTAYYEYIAAETDAAEKNKAMFEAANIFFEVGSYRRAVAEFRKVIATDPSNADAYFKLGSALISTGDKTRRQEAANYLGRFDEMAPDPNPLKADAKSLLRLLSERENIKPMKIETPPPNGRRP